jgi:hypothetical protein
VTDARSEYGQAYGLLLDAVHGGLTHIDDVVKRDAAARSLIRRYTTAVQEKVREDMTGRLRRRG